MTIDKLLCQGIKDRGKFTPTLCHFCRCRKRCVDNPDNKEEVTVGSLNSIANKAFALGDRMLEIKRKEQGNES